MEPVISISGITKIYGPIRALDNVHLDIYPGEIIGLFGPNGAGKSTLIRVISGITKPDAGELNVKGINVIKDPHLVRNECTNIVEVPNFLKKKTLYDILSFYSQLGGIEPADMEERIFASAYSVGMGDNLFKNFGKMSLGQQHRAEVARALVSNNDILLMDEPFIGIDIETKKRLKDFFKNWIKQKPERVIIFTSHNLLENEDFVKRLSVLVEGRLVDKGTVFDLKQKYLRSKFNLKVDDTAKAIITLQDLDYVTIDSFIGNDIVIILESPEMMKAVNKALALDDIGVLKFDQEGTMEDVFTSITGVKT